MKRLLLILALMALALRRRLTPAVSLSGRRVLITGGSRGLGLALAREFAARGARLALLARNGEELETAAEELRRRGAEVQVIVADVTRGQELEDAVARTIRHFGGLDVLVNVVGVIQAGPSADLDLEDYREAMEVNFYAPLRAMQAARNALRRSRGRILNVASVGGKVGIPHLAGYSASKFALVGLGQAWRAELAGEGITLTTACPGLMQTGSARNASIKGRQVAEYALFATLDNLPGLSLRPQEAARRMVNALERGDAEPLISGPAHLLTLAQALAPQLTADLLGLATRLLPGSGSARSRPGREVESALTRANSLKRRREAEFNELKT
ncbi:SDR family NAD(P)-dependent oxidoreductase [Deinococcus sp.]|uniref:SDR family NAD(P)-dependent oxidoreductase n=1 Tax=Deinococcus sp. TaxID=47478 RepID=UPI003C79F0B3